MKKQGVIGLTIFILLTGCAGRIPDLGIKNGQLKPCPHTPNCVNSQAIGEKQYIEPLLFQGTRDDAHLRLLKTLNSLKRTKILTTEQNYIRAEFTSALFRFVDDVEFYFPEGNTKETVIHVRSASRVGRSDFGANRKRIEQIRSIFYE